MNIIDSKSKQIREVQRFNPIPHNLIHFVYYSITCNDLPMERGVKDLIWLNDSIMHETEYAMRLFSETVHLLDLNARNCFYKGVLSLIIKCISKFNIYGTKDEIINQNIVNSLCPRYNEIES